MSAEPALPPATRTVGEAERLATIARLGLADGSAAASFDAVASAFRILLGVPVAYVVVIQADCLEIWNGTGDGTVLRVPRAGSFSDEVERTGRTLVVPDASLDPRFNGPHFTHRAQERMLFYVGIPLTASTGAVLGTLCCLGPEPGIAPEPDVLRTLEELATTAVAELELKTAEAELARQEQALLDRTEILEAVLEHITEGVAVFDSDITMLRYNKQAAEILGIPAEAGPADLAFERLGPTWAGLGFLGPGDPGELVARRAAELRRYLDIRPQPLLPDWETELYDGRTIRRRLRQITDGILTTYVDVTDHRRRQAELLAQGRYFELQHKLAGLSNSAPDLPTALRRIVALNLGELNGALGTVWRRTPDRLVPQGILRLADRPDLGKAEEAAIAASLVRPSSVALRSAAEGRMAYTVEEVDGDRGDIGRLCAPEGLRHGYAVPLRVLDDLYVAEFYGPSGIGPKSWHGHIIKDIECQLDLVAERDRARRRKTEFIATISHELRTPLTSMRGMLELVESGLFGALPEEAAALLAGASADSRVLGTLIEDVLAIHDIQHGEIPAAPKPSDLRPVLLEATRSSALVLAPHDGTDLVAVFDEALLARALAKLATALGDAERPALVSARRRGTGIRIVIEGRNGHGRSRGAGGGSVAVRLASCLAERAGGRVSDRSSFERPALHVDLSREVATAGRVAAPADYRLARPGLVPAGSLLGAAADANGAPLRLAVGA